jgi:hypothetical protein
MLEQAGTGSVGIEAYLTTEEIVRVDVTEHNGGVGECRLLAAASIADRPRLGASRLRPDLEQAAFDSRNAASAGTDGRNIIGWDHQRQLF